jgi:hypothetical protein
VAHKCHKADRGDHGAASWRGIGGQPPYIAGRQRRLLRIVVWRQQRCSLCTPTRVERSAAFGNVVVTCIVPAIGRVDNLFFEVPFRWPDLTRASAGFGRYTAWISFAVNENYPSDIELPDMKRHETRILEPVKLQLDLPQGDKLTEAFPGPTGGGLAQREWLIEGGFGGDVQYTIERARDRAWVQPITELSLMLAGVAFGLLPSLWRRRRPLTQ